MSIAIRQKLRPFSHTPGAMCLIPGTTEVVRAFPTRIEVGGEVYPLPLTGPVSGFTLEQDLERNAVFVFGKAKEGFYRICIKAFDRGFMIRGERGIDFDETLFREISLYIAPHVERLSLGSHKQLNWDRIRTAGGLGEQLPVLYCLSQKIPRIAPASYPMPEALSTLLKVGFHGILVPRLRDDEYQGLIPDTPVSGDPAWLIQEGGKRIRSLFFEQKDRRLALLPKLPTELHQGRFIGLQVPGVGTLDFEWSKKMLRRAVFRVTTSGEVILELQKALHRFRCGGKVHSATEPLLLEAGKTYLLDRFQK